MNLKYDLKRYFNKDKSLLKNLISLMFNVGAWAVINYRIAHFLGVRCKLGILGKLISVYSRIITNIEIDYKARIGKGIKINHGLGTVIGGKCHVGMNLTVGQNVTIGGNFGKKRELKDCIIEQPIIKDNVYLSGGSKVVGPVIIENNCIVGANAVVTKDIPPNSVAVGLPAKPIKKTNSRNYRISGL